MLRRTKPMKRTPLARGTSRLERTRLATRSAKEKARHAVGGQYRIAKAEVRARSHGRCEVLATPECTGRADDDAGPHHRLMKSSGGPDIAANLRDVCAPCHRYVHDNPQQSYVQGWLLHTWSAEVHYWKESGWL